MKLPWVYQSWTNASISYLLHGTMCKKLLCIRLDPQFVGHVVLVFEAFCRGITTRLLLGVL